MIRAIITYLLCQWAKKKQSPSVVFSYEPPSAIIRWSDKNGQHHNPTYDLAYFNANADIATVTDFVWIADHSVTSVSGLAGLPALKDVFVDNQDFTTIDLTGCFNLQNYNGWNCPNLTTITGLSDCHSLLTFLVYYCTALDQAIDLSASPNLTTVDANHCAMLDSIDLHGLTALTSVDISQAGGITSINVNGCSSLVTLNANCDVSGSNLASIDLTGCSSLQDLSIAAPSGLSGTINTVTLTDCVALKNFSCNDQINITSLNFSNSHGMLTIGCAECGGLLSLTVTGCTQLTFLDCDTDPFLTAITGLADCVALQTLYCYSSGITQLALSTLIALADLNCNGLAISGPATLDPSNCYSLATFDCGNCTITDLKFPSVASNLVFASGNAAGCLLTVGSVEQFLIDCDNATIPGAGVLDLSGQTPPAVPSSPAATAALSDLVNVKNWIISVDT